LPGLSLFNRGFYEKTNRAEILLESLKEEGVDTIFGYPGGAVIDVYDRLVTEFFFYGLYSQSLSFWLSPELTHLLRPLGRNY